MKKHLLLLLFLLLLALFPRTLLLDTVPNGLNWDETAYAYDAQSIIATGKDQWSIFLPFWLKSFGEYKPAIGSYLLIPTLYFWQWENWAVRLGPALLNSFAVLAFYGIIFLQTKKQSLAFVAGLLLAVTPWHIHFSRTALDPSFAFPFLLFGIFGLLTKKKVGTFFGFFSLFLLSW